MRRAVAAVIAAALAATVVAVVLKGSEEEPRLAGSNGVDAGSFSVEVAEGEAHCQKNEFVPADADRVRMTIGSYDRPMPPIALSVTGPGGETIAERTTRPPEQGVVELALGRTTERPQPDATVCVEPQGTRVALGGFRENARVEWLRPGEESVFALAGPIMHRFELGKPGWVGGWTLVVALLLIVAVLVLTVRLVVREART